MIFKRIDDSNVECIISQDDLDEFGIDIDDILNHKPEAMMFIRDMIMRAKEEADYNPRNDMALPLQVVVNPDKSVSITLSEDPNNAIETFIREFTRKTGLDIPEDILKDLGESDTDQDRLNLINDFLADIGKIAGDSMSRSGKSIHDMLEETFENLDKRKSKIQRDDSPRIRMSSSKKDTIKGAMDKLEQNGFVFAYQSMSDVIRHARLFSGINVRFDTALYHNKTKNLYYLRFTKGRDSIKHFATVFRSGCEFGEFYGNSQVSASWIEESCDLIIAAKAVQVLRKFQ